MVAEWVDEHLRLVLQPSKRLGMEDPVPISLKDRSDRVLSLLDGTARGFGRLGGVRGERLELSTLGEFPDVVRHKDMDVPQGVKLACPMKRNALNVAVAVLWIGFVAYLLVRGDGFGWDFRVYAQAAHDFWTGRSPYETDYPVRFGPRDGTLPFIYPPLTLVPFGAIAFLPPSVAWFLWLLLKLAALWMMVRVWQRTFGIEKVDWRLGLLALFAFNASVYADLATGNLATFEALALFLGVEATLKKRDMAAAAWFVGAACFKIVPILFLGFLLWQGGERRVRVAFYGAFAFFLYLVSNFAFWPKDMIAFFVGSANRLDDRMNNPSLREFLRDLEGRAPFLPNLYPLLALAIAGYGVYVLRRSGLTQGPVAALFAWLTLAIVLPRFMIYSYIQLLPMAWFALRQVHGLARWALALAVGVVLPGSYLLFSRPSTSATLEKAIGMSAGVWGYAAYYAAIAVWGVWVMRVIPKAANARPMEQG